MKKIKIVRQTFFILLILGSLSPKIEAQTTGSLFLLPENFHAQMLNPAFKRNDEVVAIGIPGFSGGTFGNSGNFKFSNLIRRQPDGEMSLDLEYFYNQGNTTTKLIDWTSIPLIYISFPVKNGRISFYMKEQAATSISFQTSAIKFFNSGNFAEAFRSFNTESAQVNASFYREFATGYATNLTDNLSIGVRGKILFGIISVELRDWEYGIETSDNGVALEFTSSGQGTFSVPFDVDVENGRIRNINAGKVTSKYLGNYKNPGMAFDLGLNYSINEKNEFSFSSRDIGGFWYRHNAYNIDQNSSFNFRGFNLTNTLDNNNANGYINSYELMYKTKDSIRNIVSVEADTSNFFKGMPPKTVLHYQYNFSEKIAIGVTNQTAFYRQNLLNSLSLSSKQIVGGFTFFENLNLNGIDNVSIGGGFQWEGANAQFFLATNNLLAIYHPAKQETFTVSGGLCFLFKKSEKKKKQKGKFSIHFPFFEKKKNRE